MASCSSVVSTASAITNYARLGLVTINELPHVLREILMINEPPHLLETHLNNNSYLSRNLRAHEWTIIRTVRTNQYNEFDVPLMYKIIRNLNLVQSPTQGWDNQTPPLATEITIGDDIERIRWIRNELCHKKNTYVPESERAEYFSTFKDIARRFESSLISNRKILLKIQNAETDCIDSDTEQQYINKLRELAKNEEQLARSVAKVINGFAGRLFKMTGIHSKFWKVLYEVKTEQEQVVPKNIRDQIEKVLEKWKEDDKRFIPTKASEYVLKHLKSKNCVTIVGNPGAGKTAIARHVALHLTGIGYKVIPITIPTDIRDFYKPGQRSVFVIDHIGGNFTAKQQLIDSWEQLLCVVELILSDNCKIVSSCRSQVYKDKKFNVLLPFKSWECNINSKSLRLSPSERKNIGESHLGKYDHDLAKMYHYDCFPLLCVLCSKQDNIDIEKFFNLPFEVLEKELNHLWDQGEDGRCQICALALCVIKNNELQEKWLTSKETSIRHVIDDVSEACGLNRGRSTVKIKEDMDTLIGTYLRNMNGIYTIVHNKVFDFLVYYCSTKILNCLIQHAKLSFIQERFLWNQLPGELYTAKEGYVILRSDDELTLFLNRLILEWSNGNIEDVFSENSLMEREDFRERLLFNLRQRDKQYQSKLARITEPFGVFLSSCLEVCCVKGYSNLLPWILYQGVDINQCISITTPLGFACLKNKTEIINKLIHLGADVNKSGISGITPLHAVCYNENIDALHLLLNHDACVDTRMFDGSTPLLVASFVNNRKAVNVLLNKSAHINISFYDSQTIKDGIKKMFHSITDEQEAKFWDPLMKYFPSLCIGQVKQMVNNVIDMLGQATPLHVTCLRMAKDITRDLLDRNPDINIRKEDGSTSLFIACELGCTDIAKLLLEQHADLNIRRNDRISPLEIARQNNKPKIVTLLEGKKRKSTRIANKRKRMKRSENV